MKNSIIIFMLFVNFQIIAQGFYTKIMNPSNQLTSAANGLIKYQDGIIFFNHGFCPINGDSIYECASLVRCDQSGNELHRKELHGIFLDQELIAIGDNLLALVHNYYGNSTSEFRDTDSLQLSLIDLKTFEIKNQILIYNDLQKYNYNRLNIIKYKHKFVISVMAGFESNYFQNGKQKLYPHLIWVNENMTLDSIIKIDLPYGEIYQMAVDDNGNLNAMVTKRTVELLSNGNENIEGYKGYVVYNDQKTLIKSKLEKVDQSKDLSLLEFRDINSMFIPDGRKFFVTERYNINNTEIHCWDKDDNLLWVNKEFWRDEFAHSPRDIILCKNGDIIHSGSAAKIGMRTCGYIHRISSDGKTKWIRYYGYNFAGLQNKSLGNWISNIQENEDGSFLAIGTIVNGYVNHATHHVKNDSTWIFRVDSMGCMEGNKCNDEYWWNGPEDWFQYDQLTLKHKEWNYQQTKVDGKIVNIQQRFGQDTTMYDKNLSPLLNTGSGWARYKPVIEKDVNSGVETKDSLYVSWMKEGRVFGLTSKNCLQCRKHVMLYDFTLKQHDTFNLPYDFGQAIVTKVDSISLIPGYLRKRIILQHNNPTSQAKYGDLIWIEGIGSPNGILYYKDWQDGTKTELTCYYDRGEKRYSTTNYPDCRKELVNNVSGIPDDASWYYTPASTTFQEKIWKVQALHDTTINNQVYKIIGIDKGQGIINESKIPIALVNNKMFFLEDGASHLIYDFSAQIGDTVRYKVPSLAYYYDVTFNEGFTKVSLPTYQMIIENIDSVMSIEGKWLKRFHSKLLTGNNEYEHSFFNIIQTVGTVTHGFFGSFGPYISIDKEGYFRCYQSGDLNYSVLNKDCLLSTTDETIKNNFFKVFPNPTIDILKIDGVRNKLNINLNSIDGRLIKSFKIESNTELDISDLNSGLYLIIIRDEIEHLVYFNKVVKL